MVVKMTLPLCDPKATMQLPPAEVSSTTASGSAVLQSLEIPGPAGRLEALLNAGAPDAAYAVLVCHPHPPSGGTMHNKVVYQSMKAFNSLGLPVLRFNFRGTGRSQGIHDFGRGEVEDVKAALNWLDKEFSLPIIFAGFSFGSNVGLRACCGDPRVKGIVALGVPLQALGRNYTYRFLPGCAQSKLFISGTLDEFASVASVEELVASTSNAKLVWVQDADHFFAGKLDQVREGIRDWVQQNFTGINLHGAGEDKLVR